MSRGLYDISPLVPLVEAGFVLLTPNQRLARRIKAEWDASRVEAGDQVWQPPPVLPLESWLAEQWRRAVAAGLTPPLALLTAAQENHLWQQVITDDERAAGSYHLLRPTAAAALAQQARETLLRWQVDTGRPDIRHSFGLDTDCGTFLRWLRQFERKLDAAGQGTTLDAVSRLPAAAGQLPGTRVALLEFDDIPPLYRAVLETLATDIVEPTAAATPARRLLHSFDNKRSELQAAARWAATSSREQPGQSLGIVLSDMTNDRVSLEYLLRREFDCLGANYTSLPVNFSTGITLDRAPLVRDALAVLALAEPDTTVPSALAVLGSRFLDLPDARTPLANVFVERLYNQGREDISTADLRYLASEVKLGESRGLALGRHLLALASMRELRQPALPSDWTGRFGAVLEQWGWPGREALDSLEFQQLELWYQTLDEFRGYDAVSGPVGFSEALQLLRSSCARQMSQPQTPDSAVQVLGPLEAAGLRFDQLWLCGMQAGRWPAPARPSPFIPLPLQRALQMPHATAEREWAFAAGLLAQYTRSATVVHASYCSLLEDIPELPSAMLEGFEPAVGEAPPGLDPGWLARQRQRRVERLDDGQAPPLTAGELAAVSGGSALLEDQSQCPFRAFARRRLRVEPLPAFSLALSPAERGSLLHEALHTLWGQIADHDSLLALDPAGLQAAVASAADAALATVPGPRRYTLGNAYWQLERQRLVALLGEWLEVERARGEFAVQQREQDVSLVLGRLQLRLRVDRIDRLADGSRVIIDYKSGRSRVQDWLGERPAKPQLLLYSIAEPGEAAALAFAQIRPRECKFVGLGRIEAAPGIGTDIARVAGEGTGDWETLNDWWRDCLERLATGFVDGDARVDPLNPASCTWCGLQPLCRIGSSVQEGGE